MSFRRKPCRSIVRTGRTYDGGMKHRWVYFFAAGGLFFLLAVFSDAARAGTLSGLRLWATVLVPSLLPFFVSAGLLTRLGVVRALGAVLSPALGRALHLDQNECAVFLLGLSGGYPLGAVSAGEMVAAGQRKPSDAERLLRFCDNTGPAFAVGAVGAGVFRSPGLGFALWGIHAVSALLLGLMIRPRERPEDVPSPPEETFSPPGEALTQAVSGAVRSVIGIGGYVAFFSALLAVAGEFGYPERAAVVLAELTGADRAALRALLTGILELSGGIGAMAGLSPTPGNLALASFLLGWGGLCVHLQSAAVAAPAGIKTTGRGWGKLLHGALSAMISYILFSL